MRFPLQGHYALDVSGNVLEVYATGAWNKATAEALAEDMHRITEPLSGTPWAVLMDGRRWVLSTPECQNVLTVAIKKSIAKGLVRSAYVLDSGMVKRAQLERTHPHLREDISNHNYDRAYFTRYFEALCWLERDGFTPYQHK
ncbi:hypothetical protein [Aestuariibacter sp. A3R04]|uniref:hypothetical protein n=1 Tax=Aestuariibacter sp. A3R04 TaxID=2841571 RepID=UPI001C099AE8|nr:hypothetical protein [Aestuariibacter sp. A3R04]MBU3023987.1 hypothetical protein [Aestuariibacter sp. A3R04]